LGKENGNRARGTALVKFDTGISDILVVPLVLIALVVKSLLQFTLTILVHILDYAFPILLQLVRFPLFTVRILGDALAALAEGIVGYLPVSPEKRDAWRDSTSRRWSSLRKWMSYRAFEEALHHAFEGGMAWVFRTCRTLSPGTALLVIIGAILWLPLSFGLATAMHAILIAEATSLPAWMQLLHPVATLIAKSKLLVLPAYPAAWPQAKKHPSVRAAYQFCQGCARLAITQRARYRYRRIKRSLATLARAVRRTAPIMGLADLLDGVLCEIRDLAALTRQATRSATVRTVQVLSRIPLVGSIVRRYVMHYEAAHRPHAKKKFSQTLSELYARWMINFSAEYYETKDKDEAAKRAQGQADVNPTSVIGRPTAS